MKPEILILQTLTLMRALHITEPEKMIPGETVHFAPKTLEQIDAAIVAARKAAGVSLKFYILNSFDSIKATVQADDADTALAVYANAVSLSIGHAKEIYRTKPAPDDAVVDYQ